MKRWFDSTTGTIRFAVTILGVCLLGMLVTCAQVAEPGAGKSRHTPVGVRLLDVCDGMDLIGLQDIGLMNRRIRPLWRDVDDFSHRFVGFAVTVRHVPTDVRVGEDSFDSIAAAKKWKSQQYGRAPDAWLKVVRSGDVAVIDAGGIIRYANVDADYTRRPEPEETLAALETL